MHHHQPNMHILYFPVEISLIQDLFWKIRSDLISLVSVAVSIPLHNDLIDENISSGQGKTVRVQHS
jgi:hypothetical protein